MEINQQNFEHKILEADIERLSKEIAEKKNRLEYKNFSEKELVKKSLEPSFQKQPVNSQSAGSNLQQADYHIPPEAKIRVEELVNSLFKDGIESVVKRARRASPFILDAFHDTLTDKLFEEMKKRNLI